MLLEYLWNMRTDYAAKSLYMDIGKETSHHKWLKIIWEYKSGHKDDGLDLKWRHDASTLH